MTNDFAEKLIYNDKETQQEPGVPNQQRGVSPPPVPPPPFCYAQSFLSPGRGAIDVDESVLLCISREVVVRHDETRLQLQGRTAKRVPAWLTSLCLCLPGPGKLCLLLHNCSMAKLPMFPPQRNLPRWMGRSTAVLWDDASKTCPCAPGADCGLLRTCMSTCGFSASA